jgi:hypothetical protein
MVLPDVPFHPAHVQPQVGQNYYLQNGAYSLQWSIKPNNREWNAEEAPNDGEEARLDCLRLNFAIT